MQIDVAWRWASKEDFDLRRCLYAYLHPKTDTILYIGKADRQSVRERMCGKHKERVYIRIKHRYPGARALRPIVGDLRLEAQQRFSSALLADVESLLIYEIAPEFNASCIDSRISSPGMKVVCRGDWWPFPQRTFHDN